MRWLLGMLLASVIHAAHAEPTTQQFGDWTLLCSPCMVGLKAVSGDADQIKVTVVLWHDQQQTVVLFDLPSQAKIRPHMTLAIDQKLHKFLPLDCDQKNCVAVWKPRGVDVATLLWSEILTIEFKVDKDEGWRLPIPLRGLNEAFTALAEQK